MVPEFVFGIIHDVVVGFLVLFFQISFIFLNIRMLGWLRFWTLLVVHPIGMFYFLEPLMTGKWRLFLICLAYGMRVITWSGGTLVIRSFQSILCTSCFLG
ncbi:hypothetical protein I3843_01G203400 [Carya illinoinensis]|nr:hypothetical protein I3843_01G203400 [Carya illinoinensis]